MRCLCLWENKLTTPLLVKMFETSLATPLTSQGIVSLQMLKMRNLEKSIYARVVKWVERSQTISLVFLFNLVFRMDWDYSHGLGNFSSYTSPEFSSQLETICDHRRKCSCWQMGVSCCVGSKLFNDSHGKPKFPVKLCIGLEHCVAASTWWGTDNVWVWLPRRVGWLMLPCVWPQSRKALCRAVKKPLS